jgi:hypothetical protein
MRPRRRCRRWEQQENNESRLNGSSVRRRRLRPRVCVRAQQPRLSPQSAAIADEAAVGCSSDARRRDAGDVATERRGVPSTEAPSDMQPASAAAETAAASTSRASAAESREQRRECIGIGIGIGIAFFARQPRARPPHCRRAASAAAGAAPSPASRSSAGASQPAEAAPASASTFTGPTAGVAAAGLSRSVQAQWLKMRDSRSGGRSCGVGTGRSRVSAPCGVIQSAGAQGPAFHALFAPSATQRRVRAPKLR